MSQQSTNLRAAFCGPAAKPWPQNEADVVALLRGGEVKVCGLMPWSSNYTFLAQVQGENSQCLAVYKPRSGETPLWDFPEGTLYLREYAAYLVSKALGWSLVPTTVIRKGPLGVGSLQLYVDADAEAHYFSFGAQEIPALQRIVLFDYITNNADRKGGHCLRASDGRVWAVDHGLTFHALPKLRTVIWDFRGQTIPGELLDDLRRLQGELSMPRGLAQRLSSLLNEKELAALRQRVRNLVERGTFPQPGPGRVVPWPMV